MGAIFENINKYISTADDNLFEELRNAKYKSINSIGSVSGATYKQITSPTTLIDSHGVYYDGTNAAKSNKNPVLCIVTALYMGSLTTINTWIFLRPDEEQTINYGDGTLTYKLALHSDNIWKIYATFTPTSSMYISNIIACDTIFFGNDA